MKKGRRLSAFAFLGIVRNYVHCIGIVVIPQPLGPVWPDEEILVVARLVSKCCRAEIGSGEAQFQSIVLEIGRCSQVAVASEEEIVQAIVSEIIPLAISTDCIVLEGRAYYVVGEAVRKLIAIAGSVDQVELEVRPASVILKHRAERVVRTILAEPVVVRARSYDIVIEVYADDVLLESFTEEVVE